MLPGPCSQRVKSGVEQLANARVSVDRRFPGLGRQIEESMAVAIDGEIFQDAYLAPLKPESEIYLIPKIGGG